MSQKGNITQYDKMTKTPIFSKRRMRDSSDMYIIMSQSRPSC